VSAFLIDDGGRRHEIGTDRPFRIGREPGCDIVIPDDSVSREHASISASGNRFFLRDFNSSNGTFVNGHRISADPVLLSDGDSIRFGCVHFGFRSEAVASQRVYCTKCRASIDPSSSRCYACGAPRVAMPDAPTVELPAGNSWQIAAKSPSFPSSAVPSSPQADYELPLLLIPIAASFLAWFWIGSMSLLQGPRSWLGLLTVLTVLSTAAIAAAEASKLGMRRPRSAGIESPVGWFIGIAALWIVGYPVYLRKRRLFGLKDRCLAGMAIALVFVGTITALEWGIESSISDLRAKLHAPETTGSEAPSPSAASSSGSAETPDDLNNALLLVRPGVGDFGGLKVSSLLDCVEKSSKFPRLTNVADEGYDRYVVHFENDKKEWMELHFRLTGPTALLESIQTGTALPSTIGKGCSWLSRKCAQALPPLVPAPSHRRSVGRPRQRSGARRHVLRWQSRRYV